MNKFKNLRRKTKSRGPLLIFIIIVIIFILTNLIKKPFDNLFVDEIMFFKVIKNKGIEKNKENNNKVIKNNIIKIDISPTYDFEFNNISLFDLTQKNIKVNEKLAPGCKGNFTLQLVSNMNIKYSIRFEEISKKPKNMLFKINGIEYQNLEESNGKLEGFLDKNSKKEITVFWKWNYENDSKNDKQDTEDGKKLNTYYFNIYAYGY